MEELMDITLIIFAWIFSSSLAAYLASRKGYNPLLWSVLGLLGGLIACYIIFILPPKVKSLKRATPEIQTEGLVWYYLDHQHVQHGPMSYHSLLRHKKDISYVWNETMKDWTPA